MCRFFILILSALFFGNTALCDDSFVARLSLPRDARWALAAVELKTGKELVRAGNALAEPLTPGSLVKLFTAGAVLDHREGNGTLNLTTTMSHDGEIREGTLHGDLYLMGRGNAPLSVAELKAAVKKIEELGIHKINGNIIADDTFFDAKGLERSRRGPGYAPAGALGLDLHTMAVTVAPTEPGKPPQVTVEPRYDAVRLAVEARTTASTTNSIKVVQLDDDTSYRVIGNIAADSGPLKWRFSLHEPALYAGGALKASLKQSGVKVEGNAKRGKTPEGAKILTEIEGPELQQLVHDMNVNSLNLVADNLLLLLGAEKFGAPGTREKGLKAVNDFLSTLDLPVGETTIADGSGLREENRVTARYMAEYLGKVARKRWFGSFYDSLPRAGLDGTLREIGYKNERFRVKSGRLENVFALAGYGVDGKGREIVFAYIINVPGAAVMNLERSGAEVMRYLAEKQ
jgi:D-alanyl-D-alanine carboxypeptidase/D-alanyl-D-alanine-endopeptidase (penicillin-binding protein 4)